MPSPIEPTASTRLLIADPCYALRTGHNHAVNTLLRAEAARRGIDCDVFGHTMLGSNADVAAVFRVIAYGSFPKDSVDALRLAHHTATTFAEDLVKHVQPRLQRGTILFCHTLNAALLHGLVHWLGSLPSREGLHLRLGLNLPPNFREPRADVAYFNTFEYQLSLNLLRAACPGLKWYAETNELAEIFRPLGATGVGRRRLPARVIDRPRPERPGDRPRICFLPGEVRPEKGAEFLINSVMSIASQQPSWLGRLRFRFTSMALLPHVVEFLRRFPQLFELLPDTSMSLDRYWTLLHDADLISCAYEPSNYVSRASGIFLESLAIGRPVLVSRGTSIANEAAAHGNAYALPVTFGDVNSLAAALATFMQQPDSYTAAAAAVAAEYRQQLDPAAFMDWVLAAGGQPTEQAASQQS
jgi:glycosyltransferase involved in cell wall biosynthesis